VSADALLTVEEEQHPSWGRPVTGRTRTLDSHASRVRRRIAPLTTTPYVINVWGVGYRLMLPD
jgi:DNA-binding response OmpR family regulator